MNIADFTVFCNKYEKLTVELVQTIREHLNEAEVSHMYFTINASGRVGSGDLTLEYQLWDGNYDGGKTKSHSVYPMLNEFLRRRGFDLVNQPLAIGYDNSVSGSEE